MSRGDDDARSMRDVEAGLIERALELPVDHREAFLRQRCPSDTQRSRLRSMLGSLASAEEFLADPDFVHTPGAPGGAACRPARVRRDAEPIGRGSGVGGYTLVERLGEGGFGLVYRGVQTSPVRREAAVKVLRHAAVTPELRSRFEFERRSLALMDHPGIARMYEGGETEDGRLWFAMELVAGPPITGAVEARRAGLRERLGLFLQVCDAVHHAHRRGVLHRDIKPSNVLVGADGRVRVIDFGISRPMGEGGPTSLGLTREGQCLGTPEYMSPEQAAGAVATLDTRSDVYALGTLLYEMLTGTTPHDRERLRRSSAVEIDRLLRDTPPPRPSTRVRSDCSTTTLESVPSDIDWIVVRALAYDREERYGSVDGLASDVRAFLRDLPVSAGPPTLRYRLRKYVKRNRAVVIAGAIACLAATAGLATAAAGAMAAVREGERSQRLAVAEFDARREAELQRDRAVVHLGMLTDLIRRASSPDAGDVALQDVLDEALAAMETDAGGLAPEAEVELCLTIAHAYAALGYHGLADRVFARAQDVAARTEGVGSRGHLSIVADRVESMAADGNINAACRLADRHADAAAERLGSADGTTLRLVLAACQGNPDIERTRELYDRTAAAVVAAGPAGRTDPLIDRFRVDREEFETLYGPERDNAPDPADHPPGSRLTGFGLSRASVLDAAVSRSNAEIGSELDAIWRAGLDEGRVSESANIVRRFLSSDAARSLDVRETARWAARAWFDTGSSWPVGAVRSVAEGVLAEAMEPRRRVIRSGVGLSPATHTAVRVRRFDPGAMSRPLPLGGGLPQPGYYLVDAHQLSRDGHASHAARWLLAGEWSLGWASPGSLSPRESERFVRDPSSFAIVVAASALRGALAFDEPRARALVARTRLVPPQDGIVLEVETGADVVVLVDGRVPMRETSSSVIEGAVHVAVRPDGDRPVEIEIRAAWPDGLTPQERALRIGARPIAPHAVLAYAEALGRQPQSFQTGWRGVGDNLICDRRYGLAMAMFDEALAIAEVNPDQDPMEKTWVEHGRAWCFARTGDLETAIDIYAECYAIRLELYGPDHDATRQSLRDLQRERRLLAAETRSR